ncbi:MAG: glycosyl transferase family 2 [Rhodospirillaceae bacterium]|nr:glycosyl transferase family 2 [Rhodospirillaceae bacterium]
MNSPSTSLAKELIVVAVVPCYRETLHILSVLKKFDEMISHILIIDDACPDKTGELVREQTNDPRIEIIVHDTNQGVGGATLTGYRRALQLEADIIVKVDGDGQMDPRMISTIIRPIVTGRADYAKGNRFFRLEGISNMPLPRLIGNLGLSFASKLSSGYWKTFDPTNGFTAIHAQVARILPLDQIDHTYFFESDMLYQLNVTRAVVADVPMEAIYGEETSNLKVSKVLMPFALKHARNFMKRIFYTYFLRDFNAATLELLLGVLLLAFGLTFGSVKWYVSVASGIPAATGVIILAALPFLIGSYLLISFLNFDVQNQPDQPLHLDL